MSEQPSKRLPRPDLRVNARQWSGAQTRNIATRVAILATISAVIGGISFVFLYPYFNIERYRTWKFRRRILMGKSVFFE